MSKQIEGIGEWCYRGHVQCQYGAVPDTLTYISQIQFPNWSTFDLPQIRMPTWDDFTVPSVPSLELPTVSNFCTKFL